VPSVAGAVRDQILHTLSNATRAKLLKYARTAMHLSCASKAVQSCWRRSGVSFLESSTGAESRSARPSW